jgi:hypothetical protein
MATPDKPAQVKPTAGNKPPTGGKPPAKKPLVNKRHIETDSDSSDQVCSFKLKYILLLCVKFGDSCHSFFYFVSFIHS